MIETQPPSILSLHELYASIPEELSEPIRAMVCSATSPSLRVTSLMTSATSQAGPEAVNIGGGCLLMKQRGVMAVGLSVHELRFLRSCRQDHFDKNTFLRKIQIISSVDEVVRRLTQDETVRRSQLDLRCSWNSWALKLCELEGGSPGLRSKCLQQRDLLSDECFDRGVAHMFGRGQPQDQAEARRLFGLAAAQGHTTAQKVLWPAMCRTRGGPQDLAEARRVYGLMAAAGNSDAQVHLGDMHRAGEGGSEDLAEARRLYVLAAAQGDADAQNNAGFMYRTGAGVAQDFAEARRLFGLSAAQGHAEAQCNLGSMHALGEGAPEDVDEAMRLLGLSAAQGNAEAQNIAKAVHADAKQNQSIFQGVEDAAAALKRFHTSATREEADK